MQPPLRSVLVSTRGWNGTVPNFNWRLYDMIRTNDQERAAEQAREKYAERERKRDERRKRRELWE